MSWTKERDAELRGLFCLVLLGSGRGRIMIRSVFAPCAFQLSAAEPQEVAQQALMPSDFDRVETRPEKRPTGFVLRNSADDVHQRWFVRTNKPLLLAKRWKIGLEAAKRTVEATTQRGVRDWHKETEAPSLV